VAPYGRLSFDGGAWRVQNASRVSFRNRAHQDDEMVNAYPIRDDGIAPDDQSGTWRSNLALRERPAFQSPASSTSSVSRPALPR
jgi:hypothetical protein